MADFGPAIEFMLPHEGVYSDDPADRGGQTKFGISKSQYPDVDIENLTLSEATELYRRDYWATQPYQQLKSQNVANKVFDLAVNMGTHQANKLLQKACADCGEPTTCDGIAGPNTVAAANACDDYSLLEALRFRAAQCYREMAANRPSNSRFLNGWLKRALA